MSIPTNFPLACREADHALAVKAGLRADTPIAQLSVHQFAEAIRAEEAAKRDALVKILKTTAGNIRSLGPAGALDQVPMPYRIWLEEVEKALAAAGVQP